MKLLFGLLPVLAFFVALEAAQAPPAGPVVHAAGRVGTAVAGPAVGTRETPALLAIGAALVTALGQLGWLRARRRAVPPAVGVSALLAVVCGVAALALHHEAFVKWRPSALFWLLGVLLWVSQVLLRRNLLRLLLGEQFALSASGWQRLNAAWVGFFGVMGLLNVWVAYSVPTQVWLDFGRYGSLALLALFVSVQAALLARHHRGGDDDAVGGRPGARR